MIAEQRPLSSTTYISKFVFLLPIKRTRKRTEAFSEDVNLRVIAANFPFSLAVPNKFGPKSTPDQYQYWLLALLMPLSVLFDEKRIVRSAIFHSTFKQKGIDDPQTANKK